MRYLDTSVVVTALSNETRQPDVERWLASQPAESLYLSSWVVAEFAAATARKVRDGSMPAAEMVIVRRSFEEIILPACHLLMVTQSDFAAAARFGSRPEVNLRASDALHLAVAAAHDLELVTLDKRMASGGVAVGVATLLL